MIISPANARLSMVHREQNRSLKPCPWLLPVSHGEHPLLLMPAWTSSSSPGLLDALLVIAYESGEKEPRRWLAADLAFLVGLHGATVASFGYVRCSLRPTICLATLSAYGSFCCLSPASGGTSTRSFLLTVLALRLTIRLPTLDSERDV